MAVSTGTLGHTFNVAEVHISLIPQARTTFNEFDSFGLLLGLERLPEEANADYKKRLLDVYIHRASSTYTGLVNGITRELGLEFYFPITITLRTGLDSDLIPAIQFKQNKVYIYSDVVAGTKELTVDRGEVLGGAYTIGELVNYINNNSAIYTAEANPNIRERTRSDCILNSSSVTSIVTELIPTSFNFQLQHESVLVGTLVFSDTTAFREEVTQEVLVTSIGKYYVNYETGFVSSYSTPNQGTVARYKYSVATFSPTASPIIIRSIHSSEFQSLMFHQIIDVDGTVSNGVPTDLGSEILNELLSVVPQYWGT